MSEICAVQRLSDQQGQKRAAAVTKGHRAHCRAGERRWNWHTVPQRHRRLDCNHRTGDAKSRRRNTL